MKLRRLLTDLSQRVSSPNHSVVLPYDHFDNESYYALQQDREEWTKYYRFWSITELHSRLSEHRPLGGVSYVFTQARKSILLRVVSDFCGMEIPFALMLRPDCIGTNQLPPSEMGKIFWEKYPEKFDSKRFEALLMGATSPQWETFFAACRVNLGPLPVPDLDPTSFFATWGKILEIPPALVTLGVYWPSYLSNVELEEWLEYCRRQTQRPIEILFSEITRSVSEKQAQSWGIKALIVPTEGKVEKSTSPLQIPCWKEEV